MAPTSDRKQKNRVASTAASVSHPVPPSPCAQGEGGGVHAAKQLPLPPPFSPDLVANPRGSEEPVLTVFTIGHSTHEPDAFLVLLRRHRLATLVDVRSAPYSRYAPHFSQGALHSLLDGAGVRYIWAGEALGGRPADPACYRDGIVRKGNVDYRAMARQPSYQDGVQCLLEHAASGPVVMMCSEEDPRRCHRHHLIEPSLRERGVTVLHIRRDGELESIDPDESALAPPSPQLALQGIET